jgi:hypothetical protein
MDVKLLIAKAVERAGSRTALANMLGQKPQAVTNWANSPRPVPITIQVRLCEIAGVDPKQHVWEVVVERMGKASKDVALGVLVAVFGLTAGAPPAEAHGPNDNV